MELEQRIKGVFLGIREWAEIQTGDAEAPDGVADTALIAYCCQCNVLHSAVRRQKAKQAKKEAVN